MDIIQTVASTLQEHLGKVLDELARECHVIQREREFTGQTLLLMIVLTLLKRAPTPPGQTSTSPPPNSVSKSLAPPSRIASPSVSPWSI